MRVHDRRYSAQSTSPLPPPRLCLQAAKRDEPEGTRSLPCLPCRAAAATAVWTRVAEALRARPPLGHRSPPHAASAAARGERVRSMSANDLVTFGWGRLRPLGGDRRRGTARLLRAAEIRQKTSGSDAGSLAAGGGGGGGGGGCSSAGGGGGRESPAARAAPL